MKRIFFRYLIPLSISFIIFFIFFSDISIDDILNSLRTIPLNIFIIFVFLSLLGTVLRVWRYYILLDKSVGFVDLFLITLVRNFSVDLLPARTASLVFYTALLKKKNISIEKGSSSFILSVFYDGLALVLMLGVMLPFIDAGKFAVGIYFSMAIILIISMIFVFVSDKMVWILLNINLIKNIKFIYDFLNSVYKYLLLRKGYGERIIIFILSIAIRIIKYLFIFVLFCGIIDKSFGFGLFSRFSFALAGTEMSSLLPVQGLGGFGTWELAFKYIFNAMNVLGDFSRANIKSLAETGIIIHIITQFYEYLIGVTAFIFFYLKNGKKNLQN